jgi:RHS repeat-associated protein
MSSPHIHLLCRNLYDPLDRLIGQTHPDIAAHQRFYCNSRLTTEIQGALHYSFVQHEDHLLAQKHYLDNKHDTTLLATDLQRSVLQTLEANHQRRPIAYTTYGHRIAESGLSSLLGFNGERPDPVTGHYLLGNGYRAFNPVLMCFNSPDNLSPFGKGGLSSYAYCLGDPINRYDKDGHASQFAIKTLFAWKKAAVSRLAARAIEAEDVARTGIVDRFPQNPSLEPMLVKADVTPNMAILKRDRLLQIEDSGSYFNNRKFIKDLSEERLKAERVKQENLKLPYGAMDRHLMLESIKFKNPGGGYAYDVKALKDPTNKTPYAWARKAYMQEMSRNSDPGYRKLVVEGREIRDKYFFS